MEEDVLMTHDELIAYIDDSTNGLKHEHLFEKLIANTKALGAVVQLHKPNAIGDECANCGWECGKELVSYPCPTIQAIEKELS